MAYSNMAQLRMLACNVAGRVEWGLRAIELAERLGETEILVHALNNVGTAELGDGDCRGLRRSSSAASRCARGRGPRGARGAGAHEPRAARPSTLRDYALAERSLEAGIAYCREHDLDSWLLLHDRLAGAARSSSRVDWDARRRVARWRC